VSGLISNYSIDGLRIDATKHVNKAFWTSWQKAANVYTVGEVFDNNATYACTFMQNALSAILNYPTYGALVATFAETNQTMHNLFGAFFYTAEECQDSTLLGSFSENQDVARFPSMNEDITLARNVITFNMLSEGIPIIYNGQEQHYNGSDDPNNREAIWLSGYNTNAPLYQHIKKLNQIRNWFVNSVENQSDYSNYWAYKANVTIIDDHHLALRKGMDMDGYAIYSIINNNGANADNVTVECPSDFIENTYMVELFTCAHARVGYHGVFKATTNGEPQVWYPAQYLSNSGFCEDIVNKIEKLPTNGTLNAGPRTVGSGSSLGMLGGAVIAMGVAWFLS
jgi:alpha-amylase